MKIKYLLSALAVSLLCACGGEVPDSSQADDSVLEVDTTSEALCSVPGGTKNCSVGIVCANGSQRSCNGSNGSCSASGSGNGSVRCNGVTFACPSAPPPPPPPPICEGRCSRSGVCCGFNGQCPPGEFCNFF